MTETLALDDMGLGRVSSRTESGFELDSAFQILSFASTGYLRVCYQMVKYQNSLIL